MLVDPSGAPMSSDEAVEAHIERAKQLVEGFLHWADEQKITPGELPELITNIYASWLSTLDVEGFRRMVPVVASTINMVTQQVMKDKVEAARIARNLLDSDGQSQPS